MTASALRGPAFGSYAAADVAWLLTDLSDVDLELPVEVREEMAGSGRAHYAETLPVEYVPSPDYASLFELALQRSAARVAHDVAAVTDQVLRKRGADSVLVSLARAGVPVGVLMRRWAARQGLDLPHYAVSIVRDRGIDEVALDHLVAAHGPDRLVFVDGWTGKGAIARELAAALDRYAVRTGHRLDPELAVLADPGACTAVHGSRDDYLVPSACLNSTVSGLVSRTVLNAALIGPGDFHGAKFYADLAPVDVSARYLDAVSERFPDAGVLAEAATTDDRRPTWAGWAAVEAIATAYGVGGIHQVKPGVGETTRALLRRVPRLVLIAPGAGPDTDHVLQLAAERGVPVEERVGMPYRCVALLDGGWGRGSGSDGA